MTIAAVQEVQLKFVVKQKSYCETSGATISKIAKLKTTLMVDQEKLASRRSLLQGSRASSRIAMLRSALLPAVGFLMLGVRPRMVVLI